MPNATYVLTLGLAGCASAIAMPDITDPAPKAEPTLVRSPAALEELLVKYDRVHGPARDALAQQIDRMAAQRYATVSRLFWYTDIAEAEAAAAKQDKPILALRMLGNLDEDMSCANSRFFRATLYANKDVSTFMKDNFVLYWSSERAVPRVTIDFGDGRKIQSTTTGNSAHYILDDKGEVLDVIPGLYAPRAFRAELAKSLAHAKEVAAAPAHERGAKIIGYHEAKMNEISAAASTLNVFALRGMRVSAEEALSRAQRATMSKGYVEIPQLRQITSAELRSIDDNETATWASFAGQLWPAQPSPARPKATTVDLGEGEQVLYYPPPGAMPQVAAQTVFDAQSIELVTRIYGEATEKERARMLSRLAQHALADSALNQLRLRAEIAAYLSSGNTDFRQANDFIYAKVFHTPKSDPWLGLHSRLDFTGLPGDGVMMPATAQR